MPVAVCAGGSVAVWAVGRGPGSVAVWAVGPGPGSVAVWASRSGSWLGGCLGQQVCVLARWLSGW